MKVLYQSLTEFLRDLRADALGGADIDRRILRVTVKRTMGTALPIERVAVIAAYRVGRTVVEVDRECGEIWAQAENDTNEVWKRADAYLGELNAAAKDLGLDVRGGCFAS